MIKQGLKNYLISLKYFFVTLGTMFLGLILGGSIIFNNTISAGSGLIEGIKGLVENVNLDLNLLSNNLINSILELNWNEPISALQTIFSTDWLNSMLCDILGTILGSDFNTFNTQILLLVESFTTSLINSIIVFFILWLLSYILGLFLTKFLIRRTIVKRSIWKFILTYIINAILSLAFAVLTFWLYMLWSYSIIISLIVLLFVFAIFLLLEAYLIYGYKKVNFVTVVNYKNIRNYILTSVIILLISICITLVLLAINSLVAFFIGIVLVPISLIVISLNAESYVQSLVKTLVQNMNAEENLYDNNNIQITKNFNNKSFIKNEGDSTDNISETINKNVSNKTNSKLVKPKPQTKINGKTNGKLNPRNLKDKDPKN